MIKQIELRDKSIEETKRNFSAEGSGKILNILVELEPGVSVSVVTSLGEEVLNVNTSAVYYPRSNISSQRDKDNALTGEVQTIDYYYFDGLLIELESEGEMDGKVALRKLIILYDDMKNL